MRTQFPPRAFRPLAFALGLVLNLVVAAQAGAQVVRSTAFFPFNGSVFHSSTGENVLLAGTVRVFTRVSPVDPCRIRVRLIDTSATGETSGDQYKASSASRFSPVDPCRNTTLFVEPSVKLRAPQGEGTINFFLNVSVSFDQDGVVTGGDAVILAP